MPRILKMIETENQEHLRWQTSFRQREAVIVAYHYPRRVTDEARHDHDFMEIQICAGGRGRQCSANGDLDFERGSCLLIRPGAWHYHHQNDKVDAYVCCFAAELLRHELLWTLDDPALNRLLWHGGTPDNEGVLPIVLPEPILTRCLAHMRALAALGESEDSTQRPARIGYLILILSCLAEAFATAKEVEQTHAFPPVHTAVKRSLTLLEENLAEPWSTKDLAHRLNVDISYLCRLFNQALGNSPLSYLAQARARRAAQLLLRTDKPIAEIGIEVGWPDPNYFARRFRAHFGISATEYRERYLIHQESTGEKVYLAAR